MTETEIDNLVDAIFDVLERAQQGYAIPLSQANKAEDALEDLARMVRCRQPPEPESNDAATNIISFRKKNRGDLTSTEMLNTLASYNPAKAFVICWPEDGSMPSYHSNTADMPVILLRLQEFIHKFYNGDFHS